MVSFLSTLLLVGAAVSPAQAAIAAWLTTIAPQIIFQNETSNQIRYSACNSYDDPKYSPTDGRVFSLSHKPKLGTPLAGVGWWNEKITIASIFYLNEDGNVANALFNCNMTTGMFLSQGNWIISTDAPSVHSNSGLAAIVLGAEAGYRVYYHDSDGAINELGYTTAENWKHRGVISQDINSLPALGAAFSGTNNITVVSPRDEQNIGVTRYTKDDTWYRTTLPHPLQGNITTTETNRSDIAVNQTAPTNFTLSSWGGKTTSIGISIDSAYTRFIWYIGNDSSLYQVGNQNFTWTQRANQSNAFWPQADKPNADLAVAYDFTSSVVRLYYIVKGQLSELKYEDRVWKAWSAVATPPPQATQSATPSATNSAAASTDSGLSTGAKAGIGVGVSLGAIAVGAIIAVLVLARRKKKQQGFEAPPSASAEEGSTTLGPDTPLPSYGSPALARASAAQHEPYGWDQKTDSVQTYTDHEPQQVQQLDSNARSELFVPQPLYELPSQTYSHELVAEQPRQKQQ